MTPLDVQTNLLRNLGFTPETLHKDIGALKDKLYEKALERICELNTELDKASDTSSALRNVLLASEAVLEAVAEMEPYTKILIQDIKRLA